MQGAQLRDPWVPYKATTRTSLTPINEHGGCLQGLRLHVSNHGFNKSGPLASWCCSSDRMHTTSTPKLTQPGRLYVTI
jgi:hypothetical protein